LLAGAIYDHEKKEHDIPKPSLSFWNNNDGDNQQGGFGGFFSKFGNGGGNASSFMKPALGAAGGGLFGSMASHLSGGNGGGPRPQAAPHPHQQHVPSYNTGPAPPLHIICAAYADQDVTNIVRRMVTPGQVLTVDTNNMIQHFGDPWPGNRKQFSVLYTYGQRPWELAATSDSQGQFQLLPHQPLDKTRMEFVHQRGRVVAMVWGTGNGLENGKGPIVKLQEIEETGEFQATNEWMGFDGMCGPAKTAITYYRAPNGQVKIATAREGGTVRLPWNPLAKWN
jgi:hypothetical protein